VTVWICKLRGSRIRRAVLVVLTPDPHVKVEWEDASIFQPISTIPRHFGDKGFQKHHGSPPAEVSLSLYSLQRPCFASRALLFIFPTIKTTSSSCPQVCVSALESVNLAQADEEQHSNGLLRSPATWLVRSPQQADARRFSRKTQMMYVISARILLGDAH
jgi:hypothetical protein